MKQEQVHFFSLWEIQEFLQVSSIQKIKTKKKKSKVSIIVKFKNMFSAWRLEKDRSLTIRMLYLQQVWVC